VSDGTRDHICAFARQPGENWALVAVPRLITELVRAERPPLGEGTWGLGALVLPENAPEGWIDILSGDELRTIPSKPGKLLPLASLFQNFPLALLSPSE
jgi:(1->4)-alpha-D-glucan 1-alpha-D-glucosylmutase